MKILITGSEGVIGQVLKEDLQNDHDLVLLDKIKNEGNEPADITKITQLHPHFKGIETVIHLGADKRNYKKWKNLIGPNLTGTHNVYRAAAENQVERVIYASSLNVYPWKEIFDQERKIGESTPVQSANEYGRLKILAEYIGLDFHRRHGIHVVNLRLGSVNSNDKPNGEEDIDYSHWLSKSDCAGIFRAALEYQGYVSIPCCSANDPGLVDLSHLQQELGYMPVKNSAIFRNNST